VTAYSVLPFASLIKCYVQIIKDAYSRSKRFKSPQKAIKQQLIQHRNKVNHLYYELIRIYGI